MKIQRPQYIALQMTSPRSILQYHESSSSSSNSMSKKGILPINGQGHVEKSRVAMTRRHDKVGTIPLMILLLLLSIASISFFGSFQYLSQEQESSSNNSNSQHALMRSLKDFQQQRHQQKKNQLVIKSTADKKNQQDNTVEDNDEDIDSIDEIEDPIANPAHLPDGNSTFSACLLVMDDNHRLGEWLAYHYHVLPLRYLIVTVDARSRTTPTKILNRYRYMGMHIEEWNDTYYMKSQIAENIIPDDADLQTKRDRHRMRQKNFYRACLIKMKQMNRTWTTLIDTDEFLMYNHKGGSDEIYEMWEKQQEMKHIEKQYPHNKHRIKLSIAPPSPYEDGAMIHYLHQQQQFGHPFFEGPCISCPRLQFGAKESTIEERNHLVPQLAGNYVIDPDRLDTLRYRKHAERQDFVKNGLSKSILDVSRISQFPRIQSLHRPIKTICSAPWKDEWDSGLRINHYLGSWEEYSYRDDSRRGGERSFEGWAFKAKDADETDDNIRPWISGFVNKYGPEKTKELLRGAGLPRGYHRQDDKNWTIMFLDEILSVNETKGNDVRKEFDGFVRDFHSNKNQSLEGIL